MTIQGRRIYFNFRKPKSSVKNSTNQFPSHQLFKEKYLKVLIRMENFSESSLMNSKTNETILTFHMRLSRIVAHFYQKRYCLSDLQTLSCISVSFMNSELQSIFSHFSQENWIEYMQLRLLIHWKRWRFVHLPESVANI